MVADDISSIGTKKKRVRSSPSFRTPRFIYTHTHTHPYKFRYLLLLFSFFRPFVRYSGKKRSHRFGVPLATARASPYPLLLGFTAAALLFFPYIETICHASAATAAVFTRSYRGRRAGLDRPLMVARCRTGSRVVSIGRGRRRRWLRTTTKRNGQSGNRNRSSASPPFTRAQRSNAHRLCIYAARYYYILTRARHDNPLYPSKRVRRTLSDKGTTSESAQIVRTRTTDVSSSSYGRARKTTTPPTPSTQERAGPRMGVQTTTRLSDTRARSDQQFSFFRVANFRRISLRPPPPRFRNFSFVGNSRTP